MFLSERCIHNNHHIHSHHIFPACSLHISCNGHRKLKKRYIKKIKGSQIGQKAEKF